MSPTILRTSLFSFSSSVCFLRSSSNSLLTAFICSSSRRTRSYSAFISSIEADSARLERRSCSSSARGLTSSAPPREARRSTCPAELRGDLAGDGATRSPPRCPIDWPAPAADPSGSPSAGGCGGDWLPAADAPSAASCETVGGGFFLGRLVCACIGVKVVTVAPSESCPLPPDARRRCSSLSEPESLSASYSICAGAASPAGLRRVLGAVEVSDEPMVTSVCMSTL
mmetsp:Transcript_39260/g.93956  ORF Transcript_39260/g.93956 Transcript_39260/m.93956 type:complete len:227 (+) Transcript_39260:870-1550(+)